MTSLRYSWLLFAAVPALAQPVVDRLEAIGSPLWVRGQVTPAAVQVGDTLTLVGHGFGEGPDRDFSKVVLGNVRALERDLVMYRGAVALLKQLFYETTSPFDRWDKDILLWRDDRIDFRVPPTAGAAVSEVPLVVSVQARLGSNPSLVASGPHHVSDPLTERITQKSFVHETGTVDILGVPEVSEPVPLRIGSPQGSALVEEGEAIYWMYDYNIGLVHHMRGMDWDEVLDGGSTDPIHGGPADPKALFGAIPVVAGEVPDVAVRGRNFPAFPMPMPLKPLLGSALAGGNVTPTAYVGFVRAEAKSLGGGKGSWVGMNCASCHAQRITYEAAPGRTVSRVFPGIPNPDWTMKWNALSAMHGVQGKENGETVDKRQLLFAIPKGTGENSLVRLADDGSRYANDGLFSPIAIPVITRHTPLRRALGRTEMIAGFEGSYVHGEEPDGAIGAMRASSLKALTAYLATLDSDHDTLQRVGLYRWLSRNGLLDEVDGVGEGAFVQRGPESFAKLGDRLARGRQVFARDCQSCHQENSGTWTDENMYPLSDVGTYFSPTIFHRETQSIRTAILRDLYWSERRGYLHDGHVRSLEDLVDPARCVENTELYDRYYTLQSTTFHVPKGTPAQERATRAQAYFVDVPSDPDNLYWDYQKMRREFGPRELGSTAPIPLPAAPHPWCAAFPEDVRDLVAFLLTL